MRKNITYILFFVMFLSLSFSAPCINLTDNSTYSNISKIHAFRDNFEVNGNISLCKGTYYVDPFRTLFTLNGPYIIDCNGSTIYSLRSDSIFFTSAYNNSGIANCILYDFGHGLFIYNNGESFVEDWNLVETFSYSQGLSVDRNDNIIITSHNPPFVYLAKYKSNGTRIFFRNYDFGGNTYVQQSLYDNDIGKYGNYFAAGYIRVSGDVHLLVAKFDENGTPIWNYTSNPTTAIDYFMGVEVDSKNNVIAAGVENSGSNARAAIYKFNENGTLLWNLSFDPSPSLNQYVGGSLGIDREDNIIYSAPSGPTGDQITVYKISENGTFIWNYTFPKSPFGGTDYPYTPLIDYRDNSIILPSELGWSSGAAGLLKLDENGTHLWNLTFNPTAGRDNLHSGFIDSEGNYVFAGAFGGTGVVLMKVSPNGTVLRNITGVTSINLLPIGTRLTRDGSIIIGGSVGGSAGLVKINISKEPLSNIIIENVSMYNTRGMTFLSLINTSSRIRNLTLGYNETTGKVHYNSINNAYGYLATGNSIILNRDFVSLNPVRGGSFNTTANVVFETNTCSRYDLFQKAIFPLYKEDVIANGTFCSYCTINYCSSSTNLIDFDVLHFSGFALKEWPNLSITSLPSWNVPNGTETNVSCRVQPPSLVINMYLNGTLIASSPGYVEHIANLSPGSYNYICNTTGNANYTNYSVLGILNVYQNTNSGGQNNKLIIQNYSLNCPGNNVLVYVTDNSGNPLNNIKVLLRILIGSTYFTVDTSYTNSNGEATLSFSSNGSYKILATDPSYIDDDAYLTLATCPVLPKNNTNKTKQPPSQNITNTTNKTEKKEVEKVLNQTRQIKIFMEVPEKVYEGETIEIYLYVEKDNPLRNKEVKVYYKGEYITSVITNDEGKAYFTPKNLGEYEFRVNDIRKTTVVEQLKKEKKEFNWYILCIVFILLFLLLLLLMLLRKRKKKEEEKEKK